MKRWLHKVKFFNSFNFGQIIFVAAMLLSNGKVNIGIYFNLTIAVFCPHISHEALEDSFCLKFKL